MALGSVPLVEIMLVAKCNLRCPFCYGPDPRMSGCLNGSEWSAVLRFLREAGVESLNIAGGEPTLARFFVGFVREARDLGFRIALQTNGHLSERVLDVLTALDWLCLPLDGISLAVNRAMRTDPHHSSRVLKLISMLPSHAPYIKIGTVVSQFNIHELQALASVVEEINPKVWKLYEVRPRGAAFANQASLDVSNDVLEAQVQAVKARHPDLNIVFSRVTDSVGAYLIINPDSELLIPVVSTYKNFGKLLDRESGQVDVRTWENAAIEIDTSNYLDNIVRTFPLGLVGGRGK